MLYLGGLPVRSSKTVQPTDQMSQAEVIWPDISITSGAIQYGVPANEIFFTASVSLVATPKSASFTTPFSVTKMLPPLISL